ncbi:MAG: phospholipase A [Pseudomonadota bacterium]
MKAIAMLLIAQILLFSRATYGEKAPIFECAEINNDYMRLACYDGLAAAISAAPESTTAAQKERPVTLAQSQQTTAPAQIEDARPDFISERVKTQNKVVDSRFVIIPYHRNYLLPFTYNSNINEEAWNIAYPDTDMDKAEVKFQISMKAIMWQNLFGTDIDLWGAYTQTNWMQAYNTDASSPFRETNYEPEVILSIPNDGYIFGLHNTRLDLSFNHQSNGTSEPLSRSWNRLIASALFERNNFALLTSAWYRIPESSKDDDNPDIDRFMGHGQLQGEWRWTHYTFGFTFRNNLRSNNKGAIQLDWTFPISKRFTGYVQYFNGYGESLIDYDESTNRIGIGVSLTDPF